MAETTPFTNASGQSYVQNYDFTPYASIRTLPVQDWVQQAISSAVYSADPSLQIRVSSGGQTSSRDPKLRNAAGGWTGSTRHNDGGAADFSLVRNGEKLPIRGNEDVYQAVARNLAALGVPGIGIDMGAGYIHAGGGSEAAWGYQGKAASSRYLPASFASAISEGRQLYSRGTGIPMPPAEIPNTVASAVDVVPQTREVPRPLPRPMTRKSAEESVRPYLTADLQVKGDNLPPLVAAQITPGLGSLTPDFFKTPAPPARLPDIGSTSSPIGPGPTSLASVQDMYGRPPLPKLDPIGAGPMSLASVQDMYGRPGGVGLPPATRSVPSVAMPTLPPAIPGPNAPPKTDERLTAGLYPKAPTAVPGAVPAVGTALDVVPNLPGFPPLPQRRPIRASMPTPMGQRPTLPMPRPVMGFPTAFAQRPAPAPTMRVTVNGAGSYSGGGSSGGSSGGSQPRYVMQGSGKEVRPQVVSIFNPDAPNGGAFEKRTVYR